MRQSYHFEPLLYETELLKVIRAIQAESELNARALNRIVRRYPKDAGQAFSKSEIIRGYRVLRQRHDLGDESGFVAKVRMKPIRTMSGVAPVTVLTKPYPCPGKCIFCPNDVRMPKSYLSDEPGAQRAAQHRFDPYAQTTSRLYALYNTGHEVDKVELIVLGGTWSFYPESYQIWFVKRCFDAMNDFRPEQAALEGVPRLARAQIAYEALDEKVEGASMERTYNQVVSGFLTRQLEGTLLDETEQASWEELFLAQRDNERREARCVGFVVETRPDHISEEEVMRARRLGATKVQIGFQSLSDEVLQANRRGHDVAATRRAVNLLRQAGFKIHAHWMPNLYGSSPEADVADFRRMFSDPGFRPDELKIYPCSLIETAELMRYYEQGSWRPYEREELLEVLLACLVETPAYCRITRMIRDIPGGDIVDGNKVTNFREVVEGELGRRGFKSRNIRAREVRGESVEITRLRLSREEYETSAGTEVFLQFVGPSDKLVGFCRLSLPTGRVFVGEVADSAMIREVHVYGAVVGIGRNGDGRSQHRGLGRRLVDEAARIAAWHGYRDLAVISAVGTREYYRSLGFTDGELYQHRSLPGVQEGENRA